MNFGRLLLTNWRRRIALFVAVALLLAIALLLVLRTALFGPNENLESPVVYEVRAGSSLTRVSNELEELGYIGNGLLLRFYAQYRGQANAIRSGEYSIEPEMSAVDILELLVSGESIQYRVTLVEGWTFAQALAEIRSLDTVRHTLDSLGRAEIAAALSVPNTDPEGMLHPDTYFFTRNTPDIEILRRARQRQETLLQQAWGNRLGALPYETPYEALIMASIIEKESGVASERGEIAGVFVRRLERGMRLQSDPTVIYGLGNEYNGNLTREHLNTTTQYNTYRINGLPPTPIALPGEASLIAALNPRQSDTLYFVATGDGGHYFSSTLEEHNAAVERFQIQPSQTTGTQ
jgi:UPF0755 protein